VLLWRFNDRLALPEFVADLPTPGEPDALVSRTQTAGMSGVRRCVGDGGRKHGTNIKALQDMPGHKSAGGPYLVTELVPA
jgi:hypothetical protein